MTVVADLPSPSLHVRCPQWPSWLCRPICTVSAAVELCSAQRHVAAVSSSAGVANVPEVLACVGVEELGTAAMGLQTLRHPSFWPNAAGLAQPSAVLTSIEQFHTQMDAARRSSTPPGRSSTVSSIPPAPAPRPSYGRPRRTPASPWTRTLPATLPSRVPARRLRRLTMIPRRPPRPRPRRPRRPTLPKRCRTVH